MMYMAVPPFQIYLKVGLGGGADHIDNIAPPKEASHCNVAYPYEHPEKDRNDVCWRVFLDIRIAL